MEDKVAIELSGHKAWIESIKGSLNPWRVGEKSLWVRFGFDEAVDGLLGFAIRLPATLYSKEAFLAAVKSEGEKELEKILERGREEKRTRKEEEKGQEALDSIAEEVSSLIGLKYE